MAKERKGTRQQSVEVNIFSQMIESFLRNVTKEELELLTSGVPDVSTKILLTELALEAISSFTKVFFTSVMHKRWDFSNLKATIVQSFSQALGVDQTGNVSIRQFSKLMEKEVRENVKSIQRTGENNNIIPTDRLKKLSSCVLEIFTTFAISSQKQNQKEKPKGFSYQTNSGGSDSKHERSPSDPKIKSQRSERGQKSITATEIICYLIDEIPSATFKKVMVDTFRKIFITDKPATKFLFNTKKNKSGFKKVAGKFREYFSMCFTNACITRLLEKLGWKVQKETVEHTDLPHSVIDFVHAHLPDDTEETDDEEYSPGSLKSVSGKELVLFMSDLSQFLYSIAKQQRSYNGASETETYDDIRGKVWIFTVLMNWWVQDQMSKVNERMNLAQIVQEKQREGLLTEHRKTHFVFILVEKVILNMYYNLKVMSPDIDQVISHVFEMVMDEVYNADLYTTSKSTEIYKMINMKLLQKFGSPEALLFLLNSRDPAIKDCIITVLRQKMMKPPKKQNIIQRFISSLGKIFCGKDTKSGSP